MNRPPPRTVSPAPPLTFDQVEDVQQVSAVGQLHQASVVLRSELLRAGPAQGTGAVQRVTPVAALPPAGRAVSRACRAGQRSQGRSAQSGQGSAVRAGQSYISYIAYIAYIIAN